MASLYRHFCDNCSYETFISGKPDAVMMGRTKPTVCSNCGELSDSVQCMIQNKNGELKDDFDRECPQCEMQDLVEWDYKKKQCPKCKEGEMKIDYSEGLLSD